MSTTNRSFKNAVFEHLAQIGKAMASPARLELLDLLSQGPATVEVLARRCSLSLANASQHLKVLKQAGLVMSEKNGLFVTYRLADREVAEFLRHQRQLAEARLPSLTVTRRAFLEERDALEAMDRQRLLEKVRQGDAVVIDVRPQEEYKTAHLPGALSIPYQDLEKRLEELPKDREIVAYCRGPYCVLSVDAVVLLRQQGFRASRLDDGVLDWQAHGLEIEEGQAS